MVKSSRTAALKGIPPVWHCWRSASACSTASTACRAASAAGSGLGLAIIKAIAERHGATLIRCTTAVERLIQAVDATAIAHADQWFVQLTGATAYGGRARHYHNLDHLVHGLCEIRVWAANTRPEPADVDIVKQAFWFHDAEYGHSGDQGGPSNEEASAQLWLGSHLAQEMGDAAELIRATDHFQEAAISHRLKDIMLSVDLAILGQDDEVYQNYATAIRQEYIHLPDVKYREQRGGALAHLCRKAEAGQLFCNAYFADQYNERALDNMHREMEMLAR
jgi:predicted metal-dependent HD superfamily phosphohydrolase